MKISGLEKGVLALTAAFLLLTVGYFFGQRAGGEPYTISAQTLWRSEVGAGTDSAVFQPEEAMDGMEETPAPATETPDEDGASAEAEEPEQNTAAVNINTADAEKLQTLPGIGPARAEAIIADREANGPFRIPEDITRVSGIGQGILADIINYITVE